MQNFWITFIREISTAKILVSCSSVKYTCCKKFQVYSSYLLEAYCTHYTGDTTSGNLRIRRKFGRGYISSRGSWIIPIRAVTSINAFISTIVTSFHVHALGMKGRYLLVSVTDRFQTLSVKHLQKRLTAVVLCVIKWNCRVTIFLYRYNEICGSSSTF